MAVSRGFFVFVTKISGLLQYDDPYHGSPVFFLLLRLFLYQLQGGRLTAEYFCRTAVPYGDALCALSNIYFLQSRAVDTGKFFQSPVSREAKLFQLLTVPAPEYLKLFQTAGPERFHRSVAAVQFYNIPAPANCQASHPLRNTDFQPRVIFHRHGRMYSGSVRQIS